MKYTMRIDLDTFKNGKLDFGSYHSTQRDTFYSARWLYLIELFELNYPEYVVKLYGFDKIQKNQFIGRLKNIDFKMSKKLALALSYRHMETVDSIEFTKILKKFRNYLGYGANTDSINMLFNI